jgi:hypothetical protein
MSGFPPGLAPGREGVSKGHQRNNAMQRNTQNVGTALRSVGSNKGKLLGALALAATTLAASAQTGGNAGVAEIVDAIEALAPDMGLVIAAAIGIAVIGIGAAAALALGKRLMK